MRLQFEVAAAVQVAAARDGDRQAEALGVGLGEQVGAGLRGVVRVPAEQRHLLAVRAPRLVAVGLVRRRHDDAGHLGPAAAGFQRAQVPRMLCSNVVDRVFVGRADDRLRGQVDHRVDRLVSEHADPSVAAVPDVAVDPLDGVAARRARRRGTSRCPGRRPRASRRASCRHTQPPRRPAAPVTRTERPRQKPRLTPRSPRGACPASHRPRR